MPVTLNRVLKGARARLSRTWLRCVSRLSSARNHWCNVCRTGVAGFYTYGGRRTGCPVCGSLARERFVLQAVEIGLVALPDDLHGVLHVAPGERGLVRLFSRFDGYLAGDIDPEHYKDAAAVHLDLTKLAGEKRFDLIYASHVLEHIRDDRLAMLNIVRSLTERGQAWVLVPLHEGVTEEGYAAMTPAERERRFGQWDHVRHYGTDIRQRLEAAGCAVKEVAVSDVDPVDVVRLGLDEGDRIFVCTRASI